MSDQYIIEYRGNWNSDFKKQNRYGFSGTAVLDAKDITNALELFNTSWLGKIAGIEVVSIKPFECGGW